MKNIVVFASGGGSNLQSIIDKCKSGELSAKIVLVVCNKKDAYAIERAKKHSIDFVVVDHKEFSSRQEHEKAILSQLDKYQFDLIVLAGYMRVLTKQFIESFFDREKGVSRIVNIHPALLPSFKGIHGYEDAFEYGVKYSGVTVHFVDPSVDSGPIIAQDVFEIKDDDTIDTIKQRGLALEHQLYPKAIGKVIEGEFRLEERRIIFE